MNKPRLVIGITGSSGIIYGIRLLEVLKTLSIETHLVMSKAALSAVENFFVSDKAAAGGNGGK